MHQIIKSPETGELKLIDTEYDTTEAYKRIVRNQIELKHSKGWEVFWSVLSTAKSFSFSLPFNTQLFDWELDELESLGYDIRWNVKCNCYDVTVYPANTNK